MHGRKSTFTHTESTEWIRYAPVCLSFRDTVDGNVQSKPSTKFETNKNKVYLLLEATYYALVSRSELVCYFLMILNQILYCSLLSLPLPLMVFLWGMLSVPRPSKTFWITAITYTEVRSGNLMCRRETINYKSKRECTSYICMVNQLSCTP